MQSVEQLDANGPVLGLELCTFCVCMCVNIYINFNLKLPDASAFCGDPTPLVPIQFAPKF